MPCQSTLYLNFSIVFDLEIVDWWSSGVVDGDFLFLIFFLVKKFYLPKYVDYILKFYRHLI